MTEPPLFDAVSIVDRFAAGESIADLAKTEALHPLAIESIIRLVLINDYGTEEEKS